MARKLTNNTKYDDTKNRPLSFLSGDPEKMNQAEDLVQATRETGVQVDEYVDAIEEAKKVHTGVIKIDDPNELFLKNRAMRRTFKQFPLRSNAAFSALAIGAMVIAAQQDAMAGAIEHLAGFNGSARAQMYTDIDRSMGGYADLDAVDAALDATGSTDEGALIAVGVFYDAGDVYSSPQTTYKEPDDFYSPPPWDTITIKQ